MPCLNSVDLIATPGRRYVKVFQAATGQALRVALADALTAIGWTVNRADTTTGGNPGVGFKATSAASPWCASGSAPSDYVGKCRVWFYPIDTGINNFKVQSEFKVMNEAETMVQSSSQIELIPTANLAAFGDYSKYSYLFHGTPYDFQLFMLGAQDRVNLGLSNLRTAVFAGVPQIPSFLQARGEWCKGGINEAFYIVDASGMRVAGTNKGDSFFAAGISSVADGPHGGGTFTNTNSGGFTADSRWAWHMTYGTGDVGNVESGNWVLNPVGVSTANWRGLLFPPLIAWARDPVNPATTRRLMGFMWDSVLVNKGYPGDYKLRFDGKTFIVFNNNWQGATSPYRPAGAILIRVE